jgi:[glutamine synthetase] adenylyltransferase / [glutamine synthetase]-adenylyl-L-tyrosine phosphorylase
VVYDFDDACTASDGDRPLAPSQYYGRLTQRLIAALSAPTAQGLLYEVDFRLRPSGNKGPVASRLAAFVAYHAEEAWTWEHMALTRARVLAGPPAFRARVEAEIRAPLLRPRDPAKLRADVIEMRDLISREKGTIDPWDIKQVAGGLVDVEFVAQYLMLRHGPEAPSVFATNTAEALMALRAAGALSDEAADTLVPALRLYQGLTQALRLAADGAFVPAEAPRGMLDLLARIGELPDIATLEAHLVETERGVHAVYGQILATSDKTRAAKRKS